MAEETLRVHLELVASQYKREARDAATATGKIGDQADAASTKTGRLQTRFNNLGSAAKLKLAAGLAAAGAAFVAFAADSARAASDLNESVNAVNQVFGSASEKVLEFGTIAAQVAGLAASEFNSLATNTGALLTNMGFSFDQAGTEAIRLTTRAADMASVFNTDVAGALDAINAGLRGETEPLRRYGVSLSDAAIRAKAVEMGLAETTKEVDTNGKAVAALELIYEQTTKVQGDFIRTSSEAANSQRVLAAEFENTKASFGQSTLGAKSFFLSAGSDLLGLINLTGLFGKAAKDAQTQAWLLEDAIFAITEAIKESEDPYTALADGLLHVAENGDLTVAQFEALAGAAGLTSDQFEDFGRIVLEQGRAMGLSEDILAELEAAILGTGDAADDAAPDVEEYGGAMKRSADQTQRQVDLLRELADLLAAQTSPTLKAVQSWMKYQDVLEEIDDDGKRTAAEILELAEAGLDVASAFADFDGDNVQDVFQTIADATGEPLDRIREVFEELGLLTGEQWAVDILFSFQNRDQVRANRDQILADLLGGGTTVTNAPQARAHGGPVSAGVSYIVGEHRPELFIPSTSGTILPSVPNGGDNYVINVMVPLKDMSQFAAESARAIEQVLDRRGKAVI
jgi:hypothetical protein